MNHLAFPTSRRPSQANMGFSLIEIMMAIGILVVGTAAVVSRMANLQAERRWTVDVSEARQVMDYMIHGLQSMNWDDLNDRTKPEAYLFWARVPDADGVDNDDFSLVDQGPPLVAGSQDPTQRRLLPFKTRLDGLRVYVEYYRAITAVDSSGATLADAANGNALCSGGLLESPLVAGSNSVLNTAATLRVPASGMTGLSVMPNLGGTNSIVTYTANGGVAPIALPDDESIASQVNTRIAERDPVAVRISVTWFDRSQGNANTRMLMTTIAGKGR